MAAPNWLGADRMTFVPYGASPLSLLGENVNRLYTNHTPACVNLGLIGSAAGSQEWVFAWPASGDALVYDSWLHTFSDTPTTSVTYSLYTQAGQSTSTWTLLDTSDSLTVPASGQLWFTRSTGAKGQVPAGTTHGKLTLSGAAGNVRGHCLLIHPSFQSLPTAKTTTGFIPYVSTVLESVSGAGIHREMLNRFHENVRGIMRDRKQAVFGYVDTTAANHRFNSSTASSIMVGAAGAHLPGQAGATITIRYRITDTTGSGNKCYLHDLGGGDTNLLTVDDTDRTGTMVITTDKPRFQIMAHPDSALEIKYIQADWTPGD